MFLLACLKRRQNGSLWAALVKSITGQSVKDVVLLEFWARFTARASMKNFAVCWSTETSIVHDAWRLNSDVLGRNAQTPPFTANTTQAFSSPDHIMVPAGVWEWTKSKNNCLDLCGPLLGGKKQRRRVATPGCKLAIVRQDGSCCRTCFSIAAIFSRKGKYFREFWIPPIFLGENESS